MPRPDNEINQHVGLRGPELFLRDLAKYEKKENPFTECGSVPVTSHN